MGILTTSLPIVGGRPSRMAPHDGSRSEFGTSPEVGAGLRGNASGAGDHSAAALRADSLNIFQAAFEASPAQMAVIDEIGTIVLVNAAWRDFATGNGLAWSDYGIGRNYLEQCREVVVCASHSNNCDNSCSRGHCRACERRSATTVWQGLRDVLDGVTPRFRHEYPCHSPTEDRWFQLRASRCLIDGRTYAVIAHETITEVKSVAARLAEEQARSSKMLLEQQRLTEQLEATRADLQRVFDRSPALLVVWTLDGRFVRTNREFERLFGAATDPGQERRWSDWLPAAEVAQFTERFLEVGTNGGVAPEEQTWTAQIPTPEGELKWLEWRAIYDPLLQLVHGTALDISELQQMRLVQTEDRQVMAHLSRVNVLGQISAGIAHELNQPLAAIANYAYALQSALPQTHGTTDVPARQIADKLIDQSLRAGSIVKKLRELVARRRSEHDAIDLGTVVTRVLDLLADELALVEFKVHLQTPTPAPVVSIDRVQIKQVLVNLLLNARDATLKLPVDRRSATITIEADQKLATVSVQDLGPGLVIPAKELFTAFRTSKPDGLGLGLSICRMIVEDHGGQIWCDETVETGACFRFTLPLSGVVEGRNDLAGRT